MQSCDLDATGPDVGGLGTTTPTHALHLPPVRLPPLYKLVPSDGTGLALVSPELDAPPNLFGDPSRPAGLVDCAIDRLDLIPSLRRHDFRQVRRAERLLVRRRGCRSGGGGGGVGR